MKKFYLVLIILPYCLVIIAGNHESWVTTKDSTYFTKKMQFGDSRAKLVFDNGSKISLPIDQIDSYCLNGKEFKKFPLYINGKPTKNMVFMELVKTQDNLKLYRYCKSSYCPYSKVVSYLLFDGSKLSLAYDDKLTR
jgi:hypothetical protein